MYCTVASFYCPCAWDSIPTTRPTDSVFLLVRLGWEVHVGQLKGIRRVCVLLGAFAFQALAQQATIVGTATDPSGSAVPNVTITITNTQTNQISRFSTNGEGQYVAPGLQIGLYAVRAEVAGFKKAERTDVTLAVGDRARVDFKLEI